MAFAPPSLASSSSTSPDSPGVHPISIGPLTFDSIEAPAELPIGAIEHNISVTKLVGGGKITFSNGAFPKDVQLRGTFYQPNVDARILLGQQMTASGLEYAFTWRNQPWYGKIKDFSPVFSNANLCQYDLTLEITRDGNGILSGATQPSVDSQVSALTGTAVSQAATITSNDTSPTAANLATQVTQLQTAIIQAGPIAQLAGPDATALVAQVEGVLSIAQSYSGSMTDETQPNYLAAGQLVTSLTLVAQNISNGQTTNSIIVQGATLWQVASQLFGDPSYAYQIADANGMSSPYTSLLEPTTIILPPIVAS